MTDIAYRDGIMAADTAVWGGGNCNIVVDHRQKIKRLHDGGLFAAAGRSVDIHTTVNYLIGQGSLDGAHPVKEDFGAIWVKPSGQIYWIEKDLIPIKMNSLFAAVGSLEAFLHGALHAGATAEEAVRLAILHTDGAAGDVQVERLK